MIMKKFKIFLFTTLLSFVSLSAFSQCGDEIVDDCASGLEDAIYLKDFKIKLDKAEKNKPAPVHRISIALNKGTSYKFSVCNAPEYEGKAVVQLYDNSRLLGSTLDLASGKMYDSFMMQCAKTGVYYIFISFQDGLEGCAATILSYIEE